MARTVTLFCSKCSKKVTIENYPYDTPDNLLGAIICGKCRNNPKVKKREPKVCDVCNKEFFPKWRNQKRCSVACKIEARREYGRENARKRYWRFRNA